MMSKTWQPLYAGSCRLVASMSDTFILGMFHVKHSLAVSKAQANILWPGTCGAGFRHIPPGSQGGVKAHALAPAVALPHKIAEAPAPKPE
jgi:hypothetical protein